MQVEALNIGFSRANQYLFRNLNFKMGPGELILVQGENGSGKSTLLKILIGLLNPDKGKVVVPQEEYKEQLAYMGHYLGINLALTPIENITLQLALSKRADNQAQIEAMLENFGLGSKRNSLCCNLSQGQRKKVALCCLLLKGKKLWVLDEPLTALDSAAISQFNHHLQQHLLNQGMAIIASHQLIGAPAKQVVNL